MKDKTDSTPINSIEIGVYALFVIFCISIMILLTGGTTLQPPEIPTYPSAQQITKTTTPGTSEWYDLTLETTDHPEIVDQFYRDRLTNAGWVLDQHTDTTLSFHAGSGNPLFLVDITVRSMTPQTTRISVQYKYYLN